MNGAIMSWLLPYLRQYSANCTAVPKHAGVPQSPRIALLPGTAEPAFPPPWP